MSSRISSRFTSRCQLLAITAVAVLALHSGAQATETGSAPVESGQSVAAEPTETSGFLERWNVVLGAVVMVGPEYEGGAGTTVMPLPYFSAKLGRVAIDPRGIRINTYEDGAFRFTTRIGYELGRSESDSDDLRGLGDTGAGGTVGGIISYRPGPLRLHAGLDRTIGGSNGLVGVVGMGIGHAQGPFRFGADVSATWADDNHMTTYFGVSGSQSIRSGLATHNADAGFKRADLKASVTYMMTDHWMVSTRLGLGYLLGDAADSPITRERLQPSVMMLFGYKF